MHLPIDVRFRHMIEIARQSVPDGYGNSFFWVKPPRLVPLHLVREVPGRMKFDGSELEPIDAAVYFNRLYQKNYTIALNATGSAVDDPDQHFAENYGYAAAIGVVLFLMTFTVTMVQRLMFGRGDARAPCPSTGRNPRRGPPARCRPPGGSSSTWR